MRTILLLLACCSLLTGSQADARESDADKSDPEKTAVELMTPPTDEAIQRGLTWLVARQADDGSFGSAAYRGNVAVTGLSGLALMSAGNTPGRGPHGESVARAVDYILAHTQRNGFIASPGSSSHGPMYGHGFATLFLAECYGMTRRPELRGKLTAAVNLIVTTQNRQGGWRYQPQGLDADISVTICQVMALRAARNAGLHVPGETIDRCIEYVKQSQNADGGFVYQLGAGGESAFPRSAAGIVALYSAGVYEGPEVAKAIDYLMQFRPEKDQKRRETYYFYGHYYAVQAMWQVGGEPWSRWYPAIRDELIQRQHTDGYWHSRTCVEYSTAMATIILLIPENQLPIFQR